MSSCQLDRIATERHELETRDWNPTNRLTLNEALNDSPLFRQNLTRAELIAAHIQAHYQLTLENCRNAIKTGEAFASALFNLARCLDMDLLPKQTCAVADLPSRWSGVTYDACKGLTQVNQSLGRFARHVRLFTNKLTEPERLLSDARSQLDHLFGLRASFQRASEQLDAAVIRAASLGPARVSYAESAGVDAQVSELRTIYRQTAAAYLAGLRTAISSTPLITFLHVNQLVLTAKQTLMDEDHRNGSPATGTLDDSTDSLIAFLAKLTSWAETGRRLDRAGGEPLTETQPVDEKVTSSDSPSTSRTVLNTCGLEGYLFKRSGKRTWRSWSRRWFRLRDNQLVYCKRPVDLSASELQSFSDSTLSEMRGQLDRVSVAIDRNSNSARLRFEDLLSQSRLHTLNRPHWKVMEPDLHLCTAREGSGGLERRYTFELISPGNRIHVLQAESFVQKERWVEALRTGLLRLQQQQSNGSLDVHSTVTDRLSGPMGSVTGARHTPSETTVTHVGRFSRNNHHYAEPTASQQSIPDYDRLRSQGGIVLWREPDTAGNRQCADCSADETNWASINLGVTLCTQCAAAHRGLGVHISKIRSLTLDNWEPEQLHVMLNLGNRLVNQIYEAQTGARTRGDIPPRPTAQSSSEQRRQWARAKWAQCQFARLPGLLNQANVVGGTGAASAWIRQLYDTWCELREQQQLQNQVSNASPSCTPKNEPRRVNKVVQKPDVDGSQARRRTMERQSHRRAILNDLCKTFDQILEQHQQRQQSQLTQQQQQQEQQQRRNVVQRSTLSRLEQKQYDLLASRLLSTGARLGCPPLMLAGLAGGAHPDGDRYSNRYQSPTSGNGGSTATTTNMRTTSATTGGIASQPPLILTVRSGSLAACEFLLLNGADIDVQDDQGRTALFHACQLQRVHLVCLLLRRRADQMRADRQGRVPLDVAIEMANADIVTLLRLQRLHEANKESDYNLIDDTVTDVFRDFTCRAYTHDSAEDLSDYTLISEPRYSTSTPALAAVQDGSNPASGSTSPSVTPILASPKRSVHSPLHGVPHNLAADSRRRVRSISTRVMSPADSDSSPTPAAPVSVRVLSPKPKVLLIRPGAPK